MLGIFPGEVRFRGASKRLEKIVPRLDASPHDELLGKPDAGDLQVRSDEGDGRLDRENRPYSTVEFFI